MFVEGNIPSDLSHSLGEMVYIGGMNNEEKHQVVKDVISEEVKRRLYLYSYIALIVLSVVDILFAAISLIIDGQKGDHAASMAASYVALAFGVICLILLAILSALYFVQPEETTSKRIHAVGLFRILIRFAGLFCALGLLSASFLGLSDGNTSWTYFVRGWAIAVTAIEGLMCLYELWKSAWIKENPERYLTPAYPLVKSASSSTPSAPKETRKPLEEKSDPVIEVEEKHPEPKAIPSPKKKKK